MTPHGITLSSFLKIILFPSKHHIRRKPFYGQKSKPRTSYFSFDSLHVHMSVISDTLKKVSVSTTFAQSRLVLVSKNLGLDTSQNFMSQKVSVSTYFIYWSRQFPFNIVLSVLYCFYLIKTWIKQKLMIAFIAFIAFIAGPWWGLISSQLFTFSLSLGLSLDLETNILGLRLGLITETKRFVVSVSSLSLVLLS